jgi:hypothetical protein
LEDGQTPASYSFYLKVTADGGAVVVHPQKLTISVVCLLSSISLSAPAVEYPYTQTFLAHNEGKDYAPIHFVFEDVRSNNPSCHENTKK